MKETLTFKHYGFGGNSLPNLTAEVEYRKAPYYNHDTDYVPDFKGKPLASWDVYLDGVLIGRVRQIEKSTSRSPRTSRIRWGISSHLEWGWDRPHTVGPNPHGRTTHYPGLYSRTRRGAVAGMLGYTVAAKP